MKTKTILAVTLVLTMTVFLVGLSPAAALAAGNAFHFRFAGQGADAGWTTCPSYPPPANVVCTDTFINVAEQVFKEDGTKFPSTTLSINQFSYKFDRKGNFIFVSESYGFADATLAIDKKLTSASASALVPLTTCTVDRRGNFTCEDGGTVNVSASWTGQGDLERSRSNFHFNSNNFTFNSHFQGTFRTATASGLVNSADLGPNLFAGMFDVRSGDVFVCHGGC